MNDTKKSIAVIGIGCLFPKAGGLKEYWSNIRERVDGITDVPADHWKPEDYFDADPKKPDMTYGRRGGFLDKVDFDSAEFGISPNNISATDPAQLLSLVAASEAMRDAGYGPERAFDKKRVSVILGVTGTLEIAIPLGARLGHPLWKKALKEHGIEGAEAESIVKRIAEHYVGWQENSFPGLLGNVVAGRIANRLDLGGTNCVVDAACASSLSAAHLAGLELESGRADMVVTGGVDTFNDIFMYMCFSKTPALSPTGDSRPFDANGDGTILGEGIGMVVLKRLADAERDGDRIYAVLKGIGSSSDGRGKAVYAPSPEGQVQALKRAYAMAEVSPSTVELVEAHGTGTKVGDAAEVKALTEVYHEAKSEGTWVALGSVKSQIGHTKAAAGSAGIIKAVMALHHKVLPPTIKIDRPLPDLASGTTPFYANTEKRPWVSSQEHPRRAAVSAFGFGGSNFHAVLEEYVPRKREVDWNGEVQLAAFSGASLDDLKRAAEAFRPAGWDALRVCAAASRAAFSTAHAFRLVAVLQKGQEEKTLAALRGGFGAIQGKSSWSSPDGVYFGSGAAAGKLGFVFPGQGAQYVGMGRDLACTFPEALTVLENADASYGARLSALMYPRPAFDEESKKGQEAALRATTAAQPGIGAMSLGALRVLERFGVKPEAAAGHSYGELAALCAAGVYDETTLHALSKLRGELMAAGGGDKGTMLAVLAPLADVQRVLDEERLDVVIANKNAPAQCVLSGATEAVRRAAEAFTKRGLKNTLLPVAAAFHSKLVADAKIPFRAALAKAGFKAPSIPVYANTTAQPYPAQPEAMRDLLGGQLAAPVEFVSMIEAMHQSGVRAFLEVGPGARMSGLVKSILDGKSFDAFAMDASNGKRSGIADLARALAQVAALGHAVDLKPWEDGEAGVRDVTSKKKPKIAVPVNGATPAGAAAKEFKPIAMKKPQPLPAAPAAAPVATAIPSAALQAAQEGLLALQRLQEQTALVHKQFLEGQDSAQKALHALIQQQLGQAPAPAYAPAPAPVPMPVAAAPAPLTAPAPHVEEPEAPEPAPAAPNADIERVLLAVVSEKTGYPAESLNLDMGMESDLGIDSIKRVEILSALRETLPQAPVVGPEHIGTLRTLRQIIDFLSAGMPVSASSVASAVAKSSMEGSEIERVLLSIVSEKTGYPAESLNLDMGMESDLGIDSIKRVEILSALREKLPQAPVVGPEHIGTLRTLRQIIEFLSQGGAPVAALTPVAPLKTAPEPALAVSLRREVLVSQPLEEKRSAVAIAAKAPVWVSDDGSGLASAVSAVLKAKGFKPQLVSLKDKTLEAPKGLAGLILIGAQAKEAFAAAKLAGPELRKASASSFVTVARMDGAFGLKGSPIEAAQGGLAGLAKTAGHEWPEVSCKALDVSPTVSVSDAADAIVEEFLLAGPSEVGVSGEGRSCLALKLESAASGAAVLNPGDRVLITGGARGVTAETAIALARAYKPAFVLYGRTELQEEPAWLESLQTEAEIKKAVLARAGGKLAPKAIEEEYKRLSANREVLRNLARIEAAGSRVEYRSLDIRDAEAVKAELARLSAPVRGFIHGAGVLADRFILDKTAAQFDSVFDTKVEGLSNFLSNLKAGDLKALVLFSSVSGRFGRAGQSDYAMANEVLNKTARAFAAKHPSCKVVSIGWGPWDGGMVTPALKKVFEAEGAPVIPLQAGADFLVEELRSASRAVELVVTAFQEPPTSILPHKGGGSENWSLAFERTIDVATHPFLSSHVIGGHPVLPMALMGEWLAHAALHGNPGLQFHGLEDLRVFKGVILKSGSAELRAFAGKARKRGNLFIVPVELRGEGDVLHAGARVVLAAKLPVFSGAPLAPVSGAYPRSAAAVYETILFHGPAMQAIQKVEACSPEGITACVKAAPAPKAWMRSPLRSSWLSEPLALDAAFQLAILWSSEIYKAGCLPCRAGTFLQYRRFPKDAVRIVARVKKHSPSSVIADVDFLDSEGLLVARLEDCESSIDAALNASFRNNEAKAILE